MMSGSEWLEQPQKTEEPMRVEHIVVSAPLQLGGPNEDVAVVSQADDGRPFFAVVVDGHGHETDRWGRTSFKSEIIAVCAKVIANGLNERFQRSPDPTRFSDHFDEVAWIVDSTFRPLTKRQMPESLTIGAVASCVAVTDVHIHLAQTGDCRLYAAYPEWEGGFRRLSTDHNGNHSKEILRLRPLLRSRAFLLEEQTSGLGEIPSFSSVPRLYRREGRFSWVGGLIPTRVFGDWEYHPAVIHTPECKTIDLSEFARGELFALCSDGGNRIVEATFKHFRGRTSVVSLDDVAAFACTMTSQATDDVTIIFFRQSHLLS